MNIFSVGANRWFAQERRANLVSCLFQGRRAGGVLTYLSGSPSWTISRYFLDNAAHLR